MNAPPKHLGPDELTRLLVREFPQSFAADGAMMIEEAVPMRARVRLPFHDRHLRPGGTIAGPAMFGLADCALYIAVLATIGWVPMAVTTNLSINFMSRPQPGDIVGDCRLLKLGKKLAVGEVYIHSAGRDDAVAHAVGTYSIPPR
ncbi:MAG: PaaI family thioesterase [Methylobacteriaceae bacterium]|nr:PaaI family thioesterase [Methylobacteriaceae bacterium]